TYRENTRCVESPATADACLRTFGLQQIDTAVDYLADKAAVLLCRQVVALWTAAGEDSGRPALAAEARQRAQGLGLDEDALSKRLLARVTTARGDDLVARLSWALEEDAGESEASLRNPGASETFAEALARLEEVLGKGKPSPEEHEPDKLSL